LKKIFIMPLTKKQINDLALYLNQATLDSREVERLTLQHPDLSLSDAYKIQEAGVDIRISRGEKQIGMKMGLTSEAKRKQMNLPSPIYGVLTDRMKIEDSSTFLLHDKIHPKIEPEFAFIISRELRGEVSPDEVLAACSGVHLALEILDSRYLNFKYFSLPDVVADNSSSANFVLGRNTIPPEAADWSSLEMVMNVNGQITQKETSREISGNPVNSIIQLCGLLNKRGRSLPAGSIVLVGSPIQAISLVSGMDVSLKVRQMGEVSIHVR
jgi:2-oxo-3-hexenedioate decarboxylase